MIVTELDKDAAAYLENKHEGKFPFPNVNDPLFVAKRMVISDGRIIGAGLLRITSESVLLMDRDASLQTRAIATKALIGELRELLYRFKLSDCHAFVRDVRVLEFLKINGFEVSISGTPLVFHESVREWNDRLRGAA